MQEKKSERKIVICGPNVETLLSLRKFTLAGPMVWFSESIMKLMKNGKRCIDCCRCGLAKFSQDAKNSSDEEENDEGSRIKIKVKNRHGNPEADVFKLIHEDFDMFKPTKAPGSYQHHGHNHSHNNNQSLQSMSMSQLMTEGEAVAERVQKLVYGVDVAQMKRRVCRCECICYGSLRVEMDFYERKLKSWPPIDKGCIVLVLHERDSLQVPPAEGGKPQKILVGSDEHDPIYVIHNIEEIVSHITPTTMLILSTDVHPNIPTMKDFSGKLIELLKTKNHQFQVENSYETVCTHLICSLVD